MRELDVPGEFDCVTIFCDSLNYVLQEEGVQETFRRVFHHLRQDGLFYLMCILCIKYIMYFKMKHTQ